MSTVRLHTPLCDLLEIEVPILQAGMGRSFGSVTTPELVAAVSEAGGMGCLGGTGWEPDQLRDAIRDVRGMTSRAFGVDLLLPQRLAETDAHRDEVREQIKREHREHWQFAQSLYERYDLDPSLTHPHADALSPAFLRRQAEVVLDERVPVLVSGLGLPEWVLPLVREAGTKVIGMVGTSRHAERQKQAGVDVIIAQGSEAGGHTGQIATLPLVRAVVDTAAPIPVVAAGGIVDGRGVAAALVLGAQGVWCGTAFLFAEEAAIKPTHRDLLTAAEPRDLVVSRAWSGKPSRSVRNDVATAWAESDLDPLPMPLQLVLMDDFTVAAEAAGRYDLIESPVGQAAGMLGEHRPAAAIVDNMVQGAVKAAGDLERHAARPGRKAEAS